MKYATRGSKTIKIRTLSSNLLLLRRYHSFKVGSLEVKFHRIIRSYQRTRYPQMNRRRHHLKKELVEILQLMRVSMIVKLHVQRGGVMTWMVNLVWLSPLMLSQGVQTYAVQAPQAAICPFRWRNVQLNLLIGHIQPSQTQILLRIILRYSAGTNGNT